MRLIRQLVSGTSVFVLAVSSVMALAAPGVAQAAGTTLFWCNTAGTGTVDFNTASNWNTSNTCSGGTTQVPAAGNNLVFNVTNLTANETIDDDISGLSVGSVTFQGTSTNGYLYTIGSTAGNTLTVTSDIVNSVVGGATLDLNVTISGSQILSDPGGALTFDKTKTLTINSGSTLTISNAGTLGTNLPILAGSGTISDTATDGTVGIFGSSPSFTGTISAASGATIFSGASQALGGASANTTIASGASLEFCNAGGITMPNNITLGGNDALTFQCQSGGTTNQNVTFSGTVTLTANTTVLVHGPIGDPAHGTVTISGPLQGAYTLTLDSSSSDGVLVINSSNNTSNTSNGTTGTGSTTLGAPSVKAPGTPDTGFALVAARPAAVLGFSLLAAGFLVAMASASRRKAAVASAKARRK